MSPPRTKAANNFAVWTSVKLVVAGIAVFVLAGIAIPNLVDAHDTALLLVAVALGALTLAIIAGVAISIRHAWRRLRRPVIHLLKVEK